MGQLSRANAGAVLVAMALSACSTARPLKPLQVGELAVEMSLPSTWVRTEDAAYPLAAPLIGARYGLLDDLELRGNLHVGAIFSEVIGLDFGAVWHGPTADGWVPRFHLTGDLNWFTKPDQYPAGFGESNRGAVEVGIIAHWEPLDWLWPYLVSENAILFADGEYLGSVIAGCQLWLRDTVALSLETGWIAFNQATDQWTEPYVGLDNRGAIYFALGLEYRGSLLNRDEEEE